MHHFRFNLFKGICVVCLLFFNVTTGVSSLSMSDRSTADVVKCADTDYGTGSFCSSCPIPPPMAHGFWSKKKDVICAIITITARVDWCSL